jgi:hypothetical protein
VATAKVFSGPEITDLLNNLVLNENGDEFVGYGTEHSWIHKCGLWKLPYDKALILTHNIDVMHHECSVGESISSTCMGFVDKTKDNQKALKNLEQWLAIRQGLKVASQKNLN